MSSLLDVVDASRYVVLYDNEAKYEQEFRANLAQCKLEFSRAFVPAADQQAVELTCVCAPGRVNLIGEHTDYNDGFVLPMAIPLYTIVAGRRTDREDGVCRVKSLDFDAHAHVEFTLDNLKPKSTKPNWINYVIGVVANFSGKPCSFDAVIKSNVPIGSGLSSSAALEVSMYTFIENITNEFSSQGEKALACQKAEHEFANVPCGIMDQFISTMGLKGHAVLIDCRSYEATPYPLSDPDVTILVVNSNVKHELEGSEYSSRRKQCESVAKLLGKKSLRDANLDELNAKRSEMDESSYRRGKHAISEIARTIEAASALSANDLAKFGALMNASHDSLRDDYNVSCDELDSLVEIARATEGVYGSRMTGGGFGGCTVTLVKTTAVNSLIKNVADKYTANKPSFYVCRPSGGAQKITEDDD